MPQLKRKCVCYLYSCRNNDSFFLLLLSSVWKQVPPNGLQRMINAGSLIRINHLSISCPGYQRSHFQMGSFHSNPAHKSYLTNPPPPHPCLSIFQRDTDTVNAWKMICLSQHIWRPSFVGALFWIIVHFLAAHFPAAQASSLPLHVKLYTKPWHTETECTTNRSLLGSIVLLLWEGLLETSNRPYFSSNCGKILV